MGRLPFRWIIFDAVGTLIDPVPSVAAVYDDAARRHGGTTTIGAVRERFRDVMSRRESDRTSEAIEYEFWRNTVAAVIGPTQDDAQCFREIYEHFARPDAWRLKPGADVLLSDLMVQGYRLGIASNFDARLHRILDGTPSLHPLKLRLISSEVGWRKPSREFFKHLVQQSAAEPGDLLMVGDDLGRDICPALSLGMSAVHLADQPSEHVAVGEAQCRARSIRDLREIPALLKDWHAA